MTGKPRRISRNFFKADAVQIASVLLGWSFRVGSVGGIIVETEAYTHADPASHSFCGATPHNAAMFGRPGQSYVYRSYGIHWCMNIVCADASAVLIRALEPKFGVFEMQRRRGKVELTALCSGPGKLAQALHITGDLNGLPIDESPFSLVPGAEKSSVVSTPRIGISKAKELPWRFILTHSRFLSRPVPRGN